MKSSAALVLLSLTLATLIKAGRKLVMTYLALRLRAGIKLLKLSI